MLRTVLVDDEVWIRRDLELLLSDYPQYELVGSFSDGREALDFLRKNPCDVVFTDLRMGRMGGRQLIAACAQEQIDVYMVIISAYSSFNAAREGIQYGVLDYLLKPVSRDDFGKLLARIEARMQKEPERHPDAEPMRAIASAFPECRVLCFPHQDKETRGLLAEAARAAQSYALHLMERTEDEFAVALLGSHTGELPAPCRLPLGVSIPRADFSDFPAMLTEAKQSARGGFRFAPSEKIAAVQAYIAGHYDQSLTLDNLATRFHLNKTYMCSAFRSECGMTPVSFITHLRMRMAAALLLDSRATVQEVAADVGYADSAYFSRLFKKAHGLSPEAYRREGRQPSRASASGSLSSGMQISTLV